MSFKHLKYEDAILCVIDVQDNLLKTMKKKVFNEKLKQIEILVKMFKAWDRPTLVTEQYPKGLGPTHKSIKSWFTDFSAIPKTSFSCLGCQEFQNKVASIKPGWAILSGMETHICVLETALDLKSQGWDVVVAADAVQSSTKEKWKWGLDQMAREGIHVSSTESILFHCLRDSMHPNFRELSALLKQANHRD